MFREFLRHLSLELYRSPQTVEAYATDLRGFNDFIVKAGVITDDTGFFVPGEVTRADIREWVSTLSEEGLKATSIRRKIQSVRAFYRFLMKTGQAERNPASDIPLPKKPRKLPEITTPGDIEEVMDRETELRDRLIFEMLYGCGLRRAELLSVTDSDINPYTRELRITGKGSKTRVIPLGAALMADIKEWQQERDRLFPDLPQPRPLIVTRHGAMSASMLYKIVHRKLSGTTATRKSPHTLRHTFATSLLNNGADINSVKELLGHSSLGATQIYTHLAFADLKKDWNQAHPRAEGHKRERKEDKK